MTDAPQRVVPLTSDTETKPTAAMREAIANAEVGDEQKGEDPTVNALQARVAKMLGKEAALWFHSGSICNFVATKVHTQPADAVIADFMSHIIRAESGGIAMTSGVQVEPIETERGIFTSEQLDAAVRRLSTVPVPYSQPSRLTWIEQTHNFGGGSVWSLDELTSVAKTSHDRGMVVHMDGARLLNACVASGVDPAEFAARTDSLWLDFTKGLGAPIGAVMAGSSEFIAKARRMKHVFGGAMRQAGIAAAGCLHALDHHVDRLAEDHENARRLAKGIQGIDGIDLATPVPETNMVFFDVSRSGLPGPAFLERLAVLGIKMGYVRGRIRAVTHLDVTSGDIERSIDAIGRVAAAEITSPGRDGSSTSAY
ncbi:MAG: low specificity L-threonine aldolase [Mesorhizobium sp.]|uniref:threonine aldolase family protein n=1 Tax=Mesorhizobium sp. TaxID=1871066 RepID=UPI000FE7CCB9|nr:GntG family PLP-dependent aldolase [Mesorhizobium sp.]RWM17971.1 MAG: low specificity L-threonine aldolase [Mesorhizobium sp.]